MPGRVALAGGAAPLELRGGAMCFAAALAQDEATGDWLQGSAAVCADAIAQLCGR